jgi:hypothetical protein
MPDLFEHLAFLNILFMFRCVERLLCIMKIYFFLVKQTPSSRAITNSTRRRKLKLKEES